MGTRTYSRRRVDGTRVLTRLGRERAGEARTEAVVPIEPLSNIRVFGDGAVDITKEHQRLFNSRDAINAATAYIETGVLFDKDGNQVAVIKGADSYVPFTDADWKAMRGGAVTHNHPLGTSLSFEDIVWAAIHNDTSIQAVGRPLLGDNERVNNEMRKAFELVATQMEAYTTNGFFRRESLNDVDPVIADAIRNAPQYLRSAMDNGTQYKVTTVPRMTDTQVRTILNSVIDELRKNTQWSRRRRRDGKAESNLSGYVRGDKTAEELMKYLSTIRDDMAYTVLHSGDPSIATQLLNSFDFSGMSTGDADRVKYAISTNLVSSIFEGLMRQYNIPYAISYEPV